MRPRNSPAFAQRAPLGVRAAFVMGGNPSSGSIRNVTFGYTLAACATIVA